MKEIDRRTVQSDNGGSSVSRTTAAADVGHGWAPS